MQDGVRNIVHLNAVSRSPEGLLLSFGRILSPAAYKKAKVASVLGRIAKYIGLRRRNHNSKQEAMSGTPVPKIEGSSSALILLREDGSAKILKRIFGASVPNHNVIRVENSLIYNDSNGNRVVAIALEGSSPDRFVEIPGKPAFVRGLVQLDKHNFLVGSQAPAAIYQVDLQAGQVVSAFSLDGEPNESVYGICILPTKFDDPFTYLGLWDSLRT